ncbi:DUF1772 domain-containing protein [Vallicoccus soli]|uniref:DUF1772 domain-containing protein n=1 Tax=Vallicoccus soli TaxID=2339232 RepID=A0A3A3YRC9_9ACTN|nr:DUF1772 domain-containing protein [Vallicoccus soli]
MLYAGFQWTVQLVVYPQMARVPAAAFPAYEDAHRRRVTLLVGPLFLALAVTAGVLVLAPPEGVGAGERLVAAAGLAGVVGTTGLRAAPLHGRLAQGWDAGLHRALLRWDALRTAAATVQAVLAGWLLVG